MASLTAHPTAPAATTGRDDFRRRLGYLLTGFPVAVAAFDVVLLYLTAGTTFALVVIGVPVLAWTLSVARYFADLERRRVTSVTGRPLPEHHYLEHDGTGVRRWVEPLRDPQSWRDVAHAVVILPVSTFTFTVAVTWTLGGVGELLYGAWSWALPRDRDNVGLLDLMFGVSSRAADIAFNTAIGVVLLVTAPVVVRAMTAMQTALARGLLTNPNAALRVRATTLAAGRRGAVAAEEQARRQLERDLHDGPQQRLVRMTMDLEAVARRLDDDPERAKPLVAEVIEQTREALDELRALSRGIAPPVLADRGLAAALAAIGGRCPVPVSVDDGLREAQRFDPVVENTAYYVAAEALTNVAKHSGASECTVRLAADDATLEIRVCDNGRGGAHPGKGHGLAGLGDRLATVEGSLQITSPPGGPTELAARLPLRGLGET